MYIVKRGQLDVVADDGIKIFVTLVEGAVSLQTTIALFTLKVFGELSILNIAGSKNGNRRTANVRSKGYSDLFALTKDDLWDALKEYPEARKLLIQKGRDILRKDNLLDENAPEVTETTDEKCERLEVLLCVLVVHTGIFQASVEHLLTKLARLLAEHTSMSRKLMVRISHLLMAKNEQISYLSSGSVDTLGGAADAAREAALAHVCRLGAVGGIGRVGLGKAHVADAHVAEVALALGRSLLRHDKDLCNLRMYINA